MSPTTKRWAIAALLLGGAYALAPLQPLRGRGATRARGATTRQRAAATRRTPSMILGPVAVAAATAKAFATAPPPATLLRDAALGGLAAASWGLGSAHATVTYVGCADLPLIKYARLPLTNRGDAAAATWMESRRRRCDVDILWRRVPLRYGYGAALALHAYSLSGAATPSAKLFLAVFGLYGAKVMGYQWLRDREPHYRDTVLPLFKALEKDTKCPFTRTTHKIPLVLGVSVLLAAYFRRVDISLMNRGAAAARNVDSPWRRVAAAPRLGTWIVRGDESRRRRG